jgi:hypothetical protein
MLSGMHDTIKDIPAEVKSKLEKLIFKNDATILGEMLKTILRLNQAK